MGCIVLVRCVLVLRCGLAGVVWYPDAGWSLHPDWAINIEIKKQMTSSWSLFIQFSSSSKQGKEVYLLLKAFILATFPFTACWPLDPNCSHVQKAWSYNPPPPPPYIRGLHTALQCISLDNSVKWGWQQDHPFSMPTSAGYLHTCHSAQTNNELRNSVSVFAKKVKWLQLCKWVKFVMSMYIMSNWIESVLPRCLRVITILSSSGKTSVTP